MSNLPPWSGASEAYSKAYRVLEQMRDDGHVKLHRTVVRGRVQITCSPSEDMCELIDALNKGDEERIKGLILQARDRGYKPEQE